MEDILKEITKHAVENKKRFPLQKGDISIKLVNLTELMEFISNNYIITKR